MNIIEKTYNFGAMDKRAKTTRVILHHAAAVNCTADDIQRWHKANGWAGIGYHFFVDKQGGIYRGRPQDRVGAHAYGSNSDSVGICFEGNYESETSMPDAQRQAGAELVGYLKGVYGINKVQAHRDVCSTSCPGKHFPFDAIATGAASGVVTIGNDVAGLQTALNAQFGVGLKVDGIDGVKTGAARRKYTVRKGSKGEVVRWVQARLIVLGYSCGPCGADGILGNDTYEAIRRFQRDSGLAQDGIVGYNTYAALL